ncbi:helix-turn-helix domain-containing protein [Rhizobium sp.]|jgi:AraC family transcriptional regulator, transcriptional activator of pobA|uniref:helix-turn-helix domain-containing protein n=1 Tax=Rhizobium sp. TaxID=391 RepID=UPI000E98C98C|nr:AraC family transcriptional regulator [Rhizobium sp.]
MATVPIYRLYGEESAKEPDFWLHCETLYSRSSIHRFEIDIHRHDSLLQILHISDGDGDATLNGQVHAIRPPTAIVVPAQFDHGFRFSRSIKGGIVTVLPAALPIATRTHFHNTYPRPMLINLGEHPDRAHIHATMEKIEREYVSTRAIRNALLESYLTSVLLLLTPETHEPAAPQGQDEVRMARLSHLIANHFRQQQRAEFYADQLNLSTTHLNRVAKSQSGKTLQQLIAQKQIETAKQELIFSHAPVQTIALHLGFNDPAYFSRFFVRETGMTPRAWRVAEKQKQAAMTELFRYPLPQQGPD